MSTLALISTCPAASREHHRERARMCVALARTYRDSEPRRCAIYTRAAVRERQHAVTRPWLATQTGGGHDA